MTNTIDETAVLQDIAGRVGRLTDDETALVRTLTSADLADLTEAARDEHMLDFVDLLTTIRDDEAMAEYVYAIAPGWDGTIETLLLGGRVTTAFNRFELETCAVTTARRVPVRRGRLHRVPAPVG